MQEIKGSAQGHGHNGVSQVLGFQAVAAPEKSSIPPPNLNTVSTIAKQPPPSCQNYTVMLGRVSNQLDRL